MPWATFLKAHWGVITAMDFFKVEVMTLIGPVRYAVLVVMDLKTRHVEVAGVMREAYEEWMFQVLRNLTDAVGLGGVFNQSPNDHAADGPLVRRERLGGLLNYYYREAA